jgi:hypothetical protein
MQTYNLYLSIDETDLKAIYQAGENIMIGKTVNEISGMPSVAWLSFAPYQDNAVTWEEEYGIYASHTEGNIEVSTQAPYPSQTGSCYVLTKDGEFEGPTSCLVPIQAEQFGAVNQFQAYQFMTFGMMQAATVNGVAKNPVPVSAEIIPVNQQAVFSPMQTVWVWLQSSVESAARLSPQEAISAPAIVTFTPQNVSQALTYNSAQGKFVPAS